MKVIIIEGPDNSGKNTLIQNILDNNDVVKIIHCHKPDKNVEDPFFEMQRVYFKHMNAVINDAVAKDVDVLIFNRYYQSEYIYGQLYRGGDPDKIKNMMSTIENILIDNIGKDNIYYVQLLSSSVKLLMNNEDGQSLSSGKEDNIKKELELFKEIYDYSILNKKIIWINKDDEFRDRENILIEFEDFINYNI